MAYSNYNLKAYKSKFFQNSNYSFGKIDLIPTNTAGSLYLGGFDFDKEKELIKDLKKLDIDLVFGLGFKKHPLIKYKPPFAIISANIKDISHRCCAELLDDIITQILPKIHSYLINGKNVYTHCYMGISRSVSVVLSYLMKYENMNLKEALKYVRKYRSQADPNFEFMLLLKEREKK
jgi:hypothetical protein